MLGEKGFESSSEFFSRHHLGPSIEGLPDTAQGESEAGKHEVFERLDPIKEHVLAKLVICSGFLEQAPPESMTFNWLGGLLRQWNGFW